MTGAADWLHTNDDDSPAVEPIAVIGLACRLPGARDAGELWRNLADGVESIKRWTLEEQAAMSSPDQLEEVWDPNFVPAAGLLDDAEYFDAAFFGMSAREAAARDPQQRLFLELAHTALEDGAYNPALYDGDIGVFAGSGEDAYQWRHTRRNRAALAAVGPIGVAVSSHPDYVATLASYKLNLRGPSLTLHTACSTSLVAVHLACEALRNGECDMALGGGVNIDLPLGRGYLYVEGGVHAPDGHCRAFDAQANGTVWGSGGAVVLLKRLSDAQADRDHIRAVILGNAINNDGSAKVGFTAPSQQGQAAVITQALALARVNPRTISYVEAHGTGTALGDPIEVGALTSVYRQYSSDVGWCGMGTVKTNIGHLGASAGIAGLVKTVLAVEHGFIPACLHYQSPNPKIDFGSNPFYVNSALSRWESNGAPRRAAVSSFGIGGTNAHVILEEAPQQPASWQGDCDRPVHLLQLSARTATALDEAAHRLSTHLSRLSQSEGAQTSLADVAHTLRVGRIEHKQRMAVTASNLTDAAQALATPRRVITETAAAKPPRIALMFPGQGTQYPGMGTQLYQAERTFRDVVDECAEMLMDFAGDDVRKLIVGVQEDGADERLRQTRLAQPALFSVEYALALLWRDLGITPAGMVGHSIGEYVAATLAGVFTLSDALAVVAARGRLMQAMPAGAMAAVQLAEAELRPLLPEGLSVAAVNGPGACVVAGPSSQVEEFGDRLVAAGIACRPLRTSHAFHSPMMEPMLAEFRAVVAGVPRRAPQQPFLSNVTGDWITPASATDPSYWARHTRDTVRFADCVATLAREGDWLLVECGPGQQLTGLARSQRGANAVKSVPSMARRDGTVSDLDALYSAVGALWASGVKLDLADLDGGARRVPLPTYPWEREYFWIKPEQDGAGLNRVPPGDRDRPAVDGWFAMPVWRQLPASGQDPVPDRCLLFADDAAEPLAEALRQAGSEVIQVRPGDAFRRSDATYYLRPSAHEDYGALVTDLAAAERMPGRIIHAWCLDGAPAGSAEEVWRAQDRGFFSLLNLVQALAAAQLSGERHIDVVTAGTQDVAGCNASRPEHATVAGITKVVPLELPWLSTRLIDLDPLPGATAAVQPRAAARLVAELFTASGVSEMTALRDGRRWEQAHEEVTVPAGLNGLPAGPGLRDQGVYLITGGLGGIGISLAEDLASRVHARIVLVSRTGLPAREDWHRPSSLAEATLRTKRAIAAIQRMESQGAEVMVAAADVTDAAALRRVREQVIRRFGRINGIVHAAGLPGGGMAELKDRQAAETVLKPKILGTLALQEAFGDADLDFVVLCSSATALAGGFGQVDYCAANNFLDAYASSRAGWLAPVTSVNWGSWLEVGMAAEVVAPATFRALQRGQVMSQLDHPMIDARHAGDDETAGWCSGMISAATHWVLDEHRMAGVPVLPGTAYLEAVHCAAEAIAPSPGQALELRDVVLTEPLRVPDGSSVDLRVVLSKGAEGLDFEVIGIAQGVTRTHARGSIAWTGDKAPDPVDVSALRGRCSLTVPSDAQAGPSASGLISFGPRWNSLSRVHLGNGEELAALEASGETAAELGQWALHPALLDEALSFGRMPGGQEYLPFGYGRVIIRRGLTSPVWSHLRWHNTGGSGEVAVADVSLFDDAGNELVSVSDLTMRRVSEVTVSNAPGETPLVSAAKAGSAPAGIRPADGAAAFHRLLSVDLGPRVAITAASLDEIASNVAGLTKETIEENLDAAMRSQPAAAATGDYVAPRNELEEVIAGIWAEVLGAERISVTDDFFELGGNSLVAVQVISMVRKQTGIRLPVRTFFDEPNVAGAAAIAEGLRGTAGDAK
jgi:phthiocerol/phenolphthiocerol synthesis type-I polyketide synthase E